MHKPFDISHGFQSFPDRFATQWPAAAEVPNVETFQRPKVEHLAQDGNAQSASDETVNDPQPASGSANEDVPVSEWDAVRRAKFKESCELNQNMSYIALLVVCVIVFLMGYFSSKNE